MRAIRRGAPLAVALGALLLSGSTGCATVLDEMGGVYNGGARSSSLSGEIRSIDTRRGRIDVRRSSGRNETVRYDNRTRIVNGQRQYPASSLRRGDQVLVRLSYDRSGTAWADRIEVRRSVRDDRGSTARVQRVSGRIAEVDTRRGWFRLEEGRDRYTIHVPHRISSGDARRFERLRRGDRVTVEVRPVARSGWELVRFR
jgi:hypothetical protein